MRKYAAAAAFAVLVFGHTDAARAQGPRKPSTAQEVQALREQVRELQEGQEAMRKELQEIRRLLEQAMRAGPAQPPAPRGPATVSLDTDPHLGSDAAKVVLIDFSDYQ